MKESSTILSAWFDEIQQSLVRTNAFCIAIFTLEGKLLFSNEAFGLLIKNDPIESFVNPHFDDLCNLTKQVNPIFTGTLTLGDNYSINTSIEAKVYYRNNQLLIAGGVDVSQLLEYNMMMHRLNGENTLMQRELIKKTHLIEQMVDELKASNDELAKVNSGYTIINKQLSESNRKISRLNNHLTKNNEKLNELNATKDKFFSLIAHDLRNPFNSLLGFSEILKTNAAHYTVDEITEFAGEMASAAKQAYQLVENLLDWSRIHSGIVQPNQTHVPVHELLEEVQYLSMKQAQLKNISLGIETNASDISFVDKDMTKMVLRNLVSNALKFTPENGKVTVRVQTEATSVHFSVTDTGVGIEPEHLENLFRIDNKHKMPGTNGEKGSGLGLVLCKEFVEKQGGTIWATSTPGQGSEFHFSIPQPDNKQSNHKKT